MAVYNGERYIAEAVESVLCQTHRDLEFVIVDDGSTDRTPKIIDWYAARDRRIKVITQANQDQPAALNKGLAVASNEWVAVADADDVWMPHRLETQLRVLQRNPSVRVLGAYAVSINQWGRKLRTRASGPTSVSEFEGLVEQNAPVIIIHPTALMHGPTIRALGGYDANFGAAADAELWSRVSDEHVVMSLPEPLIYYRVHPGSMSATRYFEQLLMLRWIDARRHARRQGLPQPSLKEYLKSERGWFMLHWLNHRRQDWGRYLVMRSKLAWGDGLYLRALLFRVVALPLVPLRATRRLQTRKPSR